MSDPISPPHTVRALFVEDDLVDAESVHRSLADVQTSRIRFVVEHVLTLGEALKAMEHDPADVILLDLNLPDSRGFDTCKRIMAGGVDVPIVVLTGEGEEGAGEAIRIGVQDYLVKGQFDGDTLLRTVQHAIERYRVELHRRAQAKLIEEAHEGIAICDPHGFVSFTNKGAGRILGVECETLLGRSMGEVLFDDVDEWRTVMEQIREGEVWEGELDYAHSEGRDLVLSNHVTSIRGEGQLLKGFLVVFADITRKKRLEGQAHQSQRLENIGRLASGIAHDLNNVLTSIHVSLDLLRDEVGSERGRRFLAIALHNAERGGQVVRQVLYFARGTAAKREPVDLKALLDEVAGMMTETFPKAISIHLEVEPELPCVPGDETQLQQVLMNLCINARDAMPKGGTLSLSARGMVVDRDAGKAVPHLAPGRYVCLSVADTGVGMPPDVIDRIYDPFFTTKEPGEGTGLGLSTVRDIIRKHDGELEVTSGEGKGTVFRLYLPWEPRAGDGATAAVDESPPREGRGELILVVDDETEIRNLTRELLQRFGYQVVVAADGIEGVERFKEQQDEIDLLITDMMMPNQDGIATILAVREVRSDLPVIAVTGSSGMRSEAELASMGNVALVRKPFKTAELVAAIGRLL